MYTDMRKDILLKLDNILETDKLCEVMEQLDYIASNYSIEKMVTSLVVRGRHELEEYGKLYAVCKKIEGCADSTIVNYSLTIKNFINYVSCPLEEIDTNVIRKYLLLYKMDHKIKDISLDKIRGHLAEWFLWMQNEGYIQRNPMASIVKIKYPKKKKPSIDPMELEHLRDVCRDDRERCLVEVLYATGCRISEALSIKVTDIPFESAHPEIQVTGKGSKDRTVYFSPRSISSIKRYLSSRKHESEYLFINERGGGQMQPSNAQKRFRELRVLAGLETKNLTPHTMRHTMATQMSKIAPIQIVQHQLGHSKLDTTMQYVDVAEEDAKMYHARAI